MTRDFDATLATRMAAWALVLPLLKRVRSLSALARLMWRDGRRQGVDRRQQVLDHVRLVYRGRPLFGDNCLERSLVAYRFLSEAGEEPTLVIGARQTEPSVAAHAWVVVNGRPIGDVDGFEPVVAFGPEGRPIAVA
jgi:hypothetical protein